MTPPFILSTTGTRNVTEIAAGHVLADRFDRFEDVDRFISGACNGWDAYAGRFWLFNFYAAEHQVIVPGNTSQVDWWWLESYVQEFIREHHVKLIVTRMPEGSPYRARNQELVKPASMLFFCAEYPEKSGYSRRSGTWQTVRLARNAGLWTEGVTLKKDDR